MKPQTFALFASLLSFTCLSSAYAADPKIGYVNLERVVIQAPSAIRMGKKLEAEFSQRDQELKKMVANIQSIQDGLADQGEKLSSTDRTAKNRELAELAREFEHKKQKFQEDLSIRQNEATSEVIEKANIAIKRIAESDGFDLILQEAVVVSHSLDITDRVIKSLSNDK